MQVTRKLVFVTCAVSCLTIGVASFAQAAPVAGVVQAAPAVVTTETSHAAPLVEKAWYRCWRCGWRWRHWHRWHRW